MTTPSDTPRTDEVVCYDIRHSSSRKPCVPADFARELERDLAAAQERIRTVESALAQEREARRAAEKDARLLAFLLDCYEVNADSFIWRRSGSVNADKVRDELSAIAGEKAAAIAGTK